MDELTLISLDSNLFNDTHGLSSTRGDRIPPPVLPLTLQGSNYVSVARMKYTLSRCTSIFVPHVLRSPSPFRIAPHQLHRTRTAHTAPPPDSFQLLGLSRPTSHAPYYHEQSKRRVLSNLFLVRQRELSGRGMPSAFESRSSQILTCTRDQNTRSQRSGGWPATSPCQTRCTRSAISHPGSVNGKSATYAEYSRRAPCRAGISLI